MDRNDNRGTGVKPRQKAAPRRAGVGPDPVLLAQAHRIVQQTPEVRPEKVAALQEALKQGTYEIDPRKLANRLIAELLLHRWLCRR
jgi:flagellar biosynthesis anti-sigma factor FlgM